MDSRSDQRQPLSGRRPSKPSIRHGEKVVKTAPATVLPNSQDNTSALAAESAAAARLVEVSSESDDEQEEAEVDPEVDDDDDDREQQTVQQERQEQTIASDPEENMGSKRKRSAYESLSELLDFFNYKNKPLPFPEVMELMYEKLEMTKEEVQVALEE
ncbi:hypothetical protein HKX48_002927, partial [Thoreauomyces humboldtii]